MTKKELTELLQKPIDLAQYIMQRTEEAEQLRINLVNEKLYHKRLRKRNKEQAIKIQILLDALKETESKLKIKDKVNKKLYAKVISLINWKKNKWRWLKKWIKKRNR